MLSPITRIADFGRNYALLGAVGTCLACAWSLELQGPVAPIDEAVASDSWTGGDILLSSDEAARPRLEVAIAELPMAELPPFDTSALERSEPGASGEARPMHGRFAHALTPLRRQVTTMRVASASELNQAFEAHDYTLDRARRGGHVPALEIDRVPGDLVQVRDGNERKELFIKALLPMVLEANERVLAERAHLKRLRDRHGAGRGLSVIERMWLAEVADRYGAQSAEFDELLQRVDIVPPSMAIAQAGVESGWGTSYAARVGNSLFGQIQVVGRHSVAVPWQPGHAMPQPFANVAESVEAYVMNLNTHFAYADFRVERARLRAQGKEPDGYHLMGQLRRYSELGQGYINFVRNVIRENRLSDFDGAKLPPI